MRGGHDEETRRPTGGDKDKRGHDEETPRIRRGYDEDTTRIRRGYKDFRGYKEDTRIQGRYEEETPPIGG